MDKRPRTPARCPFYFLDTERNNAVEVTSIIALVIILGLGFWVSERSKDKANAEAIQKARYGFMSLVNELEVDGISDELVQWLEARVRIQTGKSLSVLTDELKDMLNEEDGKKQVIVQLMLLQQYYLEEQQNTEERMQWHKYVETFRQMNKAQQKHEIERLKKVAIDGSSEDSEKLNSLELIYLGSDSKTTDVMMGGVKLFTLKEK